MTMNTCARTLLLVLASCALTAGGWAGEPDTLSRKICRTTERELNVVLSFSFGTVSVSRGEPEKILTLQGAASNKPELSMDYAVRNRVGYLDLELGTGGNGEATSGLSLSQLDRGKWSLNLTDAVPISFDVELAASKGDFDLSGLQVRDFNLSTSASEVTLSFDSPNTSTIENLNIETGVSTFAGRNLGNANFRRMRFEGGVGTYTLDFSGLAEREVDVDATVGMGTLTIIVPLTVGARIFYDENWMSSINLQEGWTTTAENEFSTENYRSAGARMNIRVESGLGSIKIRRR